MSYIRIWIHMVFSTKYRNPVLTAKKRKALFQHMIMNAKCKEIWLDCIGGYDDHVHCLISLKSTQSISKVAQLLKGESSRWMNLNYFKPGKVLWQTDYWAVSVSENQLRRLRRYIGQQEKHHQQKSFKNEILTLALKDKLINADSKI